MVAFGPAICCHLSAHGAVCCLRSGVPCGHWRGGWALRAGDQTKLRAKRPPVRSNGPYFASLLFETATARQPAKLGKSPFANQRNVAPQLLPARSAESHPWCGRPCEGSGLTEAHPRVNPYAYWDPNRYLY